MNNKKTLTIATMLIIIFGMSTYLLADSTNIIALIQGGSYYDNIQYIDMPTSSDNMVLQDVELEDYYSAKVANLYNVNSNIYSAGNIEFAYNLDQDNNFVDGYIVKSSDRTATNLDSANDKCTTSAVEGYCLTEEQYTDLTADIPEIEEVSQEEYDAMSKDQIEQLHQQEAEIEQMYEQALSPYKIDRQAEQFNKDDVIVDYYEDATSYNNAISKEFGTPTTYNDLVNYVR